MEVFAKCARCGATVLPCDAKETAGGTRVRFWAAATTCTVDIDGGMELDLGGAAVLCPDCMSKLKSWLSGGPEDQQGQEEACQGADGDSAGSLAADLARAVKNVTSLGQCRQQLACGYFGHVGGVACLDREASVHRDECPAYFTDGGPEVCRAAMLDGISRRCEELGIDLGGEADAK